MPTFLPYKRISKHFKKHGFVVRIDMFKTDVAVFFDPADVVYYMNKSFGMDAEIGDFGTNARAEAGAFYNKDDVPAFFILFHMEDPPFGVVAHECVHSAVGICTKLGVPFDQPNDETLAYMVDYLSQNIVDEIRAHARSKDNG